MKLLKPSWMSNNDKPIFSIDIHPDNSRCATAVQGETMGIGEIIIWNMGPIRDEEQEKDPNVPSVLCRMESHNACVNCVRWSADGRYLASASDDKLVIVWHCLRGGDEGSFGSKNIESWKVASTLRGHSGDVLDLTWSANLLWLASCSVDNTIIIWNVDNLPERVATLDKHTSMVKGVSFDPTASYLASQSDDQTVRIWRTYDWKETKCISEPFANSSGNNHLLRLDWSPDGDSLVATNAVNNSFPVAQIIERSDWNTRLDMVGHRKPTTCVRYNPRLFKHLKPHKNTTTTRSHHAICGLGSKDRSLSIWSTDLGRPLVVIHDFFKSSVLDISWAQNGSEMLCCSWDGTVAYAWFSEEEIGRPISQKAKEDLLHELYGKTALIYKGKSGRKPLICESVAQLSMLDEEDKYAGMNEVQRHMKITKELQQQHHSDLASLSEKKKQTAEKQPTEKQQSEKQATDKQKGEVAYLEAPDVSMDLSNSSKSPNKQIETRTKDGKRKIMPIFLSSQPLLTGEAPQPFTTSLEPSFSSSKECSTIQVEKQPPTDKFTSILPKPITPLISEVQGFLGRKRDSRGVLRCKPQDTSRCEEAVPDNVITQASGALSAPRHFSIPALKAIKDKSSMTVSRSQEGSLVVECLNSTHLSRNHSINKVRALRNNDVIWQNVLSLPIIAFTANSQFVAAMTSDHVLHTFKSLSGRVVHPPLQMDSLPSLLKINSSYVMLVTSRGVLFVWDLVPPTCLIRNESLEPLFSVKSENLRIFQAMITDLGIPIISLSNGRSYSYNRHFKNWVLVSSVCDLTSMLSDFNTPSETSHQASVLHNISKRKRGLEVPWEAMSCDSTVQEMATVAHLESKINASLVLKLPEDFLLWTLTYVRYLCKYDMELRLRDLLQELINPYLKAIDASPDTEVLGINKEHLFKQIFKIIHENPNLENLYNEFNSQLESIFL